MSKFNVNFSPEVYKLVGEMATERNQTMADVVRDSISMVAWIDDQLRVGHKLLIQRGSTVTEILVPYVSLLKPQRPVLPEPKVAEPPVPVAAR